MKHTTAINKYKNIIDSIYDKFDYYQNLDGVSYEGEKDIRVFLVSELEKVAEEARKEVIGQIKYRFETMVFDDTGEDKMINIMEFRREQSKYLDQLKSQESKEGEK